VSELDRLCARISRLIVASLALEGLPADVPEPDEPLFGGALGLDSVDALELVVALEKEFGIAIPNEELSADALGSVRKLAELVTRLRGEPTEQASA